MLRLYVCTYLSDPWLHQFNNMQQKDKIEMHISMDAFQINVDHVINLFVLHFLFFFACFVDYLFIFIHSIILLLIRSISHSFILHTFIHSYYIHSFFYYSIL